MNKTTKIILEVIVCVLALVLIILLGKLSFALFDLYKIQNFHPPGLTEANTVGNPVATSSLPGTTVTPKTTPKTVKPKAPLTYTEAVQLYDGSRFQFSSNCTHVTPASFVLKKGEKFMIDNLDTKTHVFTVASQKFTVKAYHYVLVTAVTTGKIPVLCDNVGRATVNIYP